MKHIHQTGILKPRNRSGSTVPTEPISKPSTESTEQAKRVRRNEEHSVDNMRKSLGIEVHLKGARQNESGADERITPLRASLLLPLFFGAVSRQSHSNDERRRSEIEASNDVPHRVRRSHDTTKEVSRESISRIIIAPQEQEEFIELDEAVHRRSKRESEDSKEGADDAKTVILNYELFVEHSVDQINDKATAEDNSALSEIANRLLSPCACSKKTSTQSEEPKEVEKEEAEEKHVVPIDATDAKPDDVKISA